MHPIVRAYRDLFRADKLGLRDEMYTPEEVRRIFTEYRDMIHEARTPTLSREEFTKTAPKVPFRQSD
jgi:hypothetical protein